MVLKPHLICCSEWLSLPVNQQNYCYWNIFITFQRLSSKWQNRYKTRILLISLVVLWVIPTENSTLSNSLLYWYMRTTCLLLLRPRYSAACTKKRVMAVAEAFKERTEFMTTLCKSAGPRIYPGRVWSCLEKRWHKTIASCSSNNSSSKSISTCNLSLACKYLQQMRGIFSKVYLADLNCLHPTNTRILA